MLVFAAVAGKQSNAGSYLYLHDITSWNVCTTCPYCIYDWVVPPYLLYCSERLYAVVPLVQYEGVEKVRQYEVRLV